MDYKKIIKSRKTRQQILRLVNFIPDKTMLRIQYRIKMGRLLNLKQPKVFTEKIQWYKLFWRNPIMIQCVDKYEVRKYLEENGLESLLTKCYGVYEAVAEIDFESLPNSFVVKDTLAGGGTSVIIVKDKSTTDLEKLKCTMETWLKREVKKGGGREWPYYFGKKHRIIIQEYLQGDSQHGLSDYKFFTFGGRVQFIQYMTDRKLGTGQMTQGFFTREFELTNVNVGSHNRFRTEEVVKPPKFERMREIAETLGKAFPFVRVDLYNINGRIIFGELTFFPASGYQRFSDPAFDSVLGECFQLAERYHS